MTPPPTSIDGTDITGATIDGTDVQEITVDGQTVFSAETLPVAYSNLIAWYAFDSAEYGGSNADDVTALFNPGQSGDSTAYDGTVNGASYQSSGGITDIIAGANSGAFEFDGSNDTITTNFSETSSNYTIMLWMKVDNSGFNTALANERRANGDGFTFGIDGSDFVFDYYQFYGSKRISGAGQNQFFHFAVTSDSNYYVDGALVGSDNASTLVAPRALLIGDFYDGGTFFGGYMDDIRIYNTNLSGTQIDQIYQNTEP